MDKKKLRNTIQGSIIGISLTLGGLSLIDSAGYHIKLVHQIKNVINSEDNYDCQGSTIYIENSDEFDQYISYHPTFSEIREVVNENDNLSDNDKSQLLFVIDRIEDKIPFIDTRALYENYASLRITRNKDEGNHYTSGSFNPNEKKINLKTDNEHVFTHEGLHPNNNMVFYDDKGNCIVKNFCVGNYDYSFLKEGLNEWLNQYLFDYSDLSYKVEVNDVELFKFICHFTDKDLVKVCNQGNYKDILSKLDISDDDKQELVRICKKSYDYYFDKDLENITGSEYIKKYEILLKACINSRKNETPSSYVYEMEDLLANSYLQYQNIFPNECSTIEDIIINEVQEKIKPKNGVAIYNKLGEQVTYFDLINLYLIYNSLGTGDFQYIIGERYLLEEKIQYHVDKNDFIERFVNNNLLADNKYNPEIISIKELINHYGDGRVQYTYDDLCNMHKKSMTREKKMVKEKLH